MSISKVKGPTNKAPLRYRCDDCGWSGTPDEAVAWLEDSGANDVRASEADCPQCGEPMVEGK